MLVAVQRTTCPIDRSPIVKHTVEQDPEVDKILSKNIHGLISTQLDQASDDDHLLPNPISGHPFSR